MDKQTQQNLLNLVKKNYEEIAEDFNETRKKYLWPELIKLAGIVKDGDRILDVGCGNGRLLEAFKDKKIEYVGVDNSEKLIKLAGIRFQQLSYELRVMSYEFIVGDILVLDKLAEKDFNFVFCVAVLHHIPGRDLQIRALKQIRDKLAANGKIILTVWNLWSQKKFRKLILKNLFFKLLGKNKMEAGDMVFDWKNHKGEKVSQRYYHAFRKNELKRIIKEAGLNIEKIYKDKYNYYMVLKK